MRSFTLYIRTIPSIFMRSFIWHDSHDAMCLEKYIDRSLYDASAIGIFDTKDVLTFIMMCP